MIETISLITMAVGVALLFVAAVLWFVTKGLRHSKRDGYPLKQVGWGWGYGRTKRHKGHDGWPDGS